MTALRPAFAALLAADGWLPEACARPDEGSRMGGGIAQDALSSRGGRFPLPVRARRTGWRRDAVYDHLAWGVVGIYRGRQDETVYQRLDD